jgi:hypothetical protein
MNDGITFRDTVFIIGDEAMSIAANTGFDVLAGYNDGKLMASIDLSVIRKIFDIVLVKESLKELLALAREAYRRKKDAPSMPLVPVFSETVDLGQTLEALQRVAETDYLHEHAEMKTDTIVLAGLQELLKKGDREATERLLNKVVIRARAEKIRLFFDYEYDGSLSLQEAEKEIATLSSLGFNGARIGLDTYNGNRDSATITAILKALKQAVGEANADAMVAAFLPEWDTVAMVAGIAESLGMKPAMRYLPGFRPSAIRSGVWLEMSLFKYAYDPATGQTKREEYEYNRANAAAFAKELDVLLNTNEASIVGVNTGIWEEVKVQLDSTGADEFRDFIVDLLNQRSDKLDRDPIYQFNKGRDLAWREDQRKVPAVNNELKREALELLVTYTALSSDAANNQLDNTKIDAFAGQLSNLAGMPALGVSAWKEAVSLFNYELRLMNESDQTAERYLHASYAAGYLRGILERSMVKEEIQDKQFVSSELEAKYGWLLVEAGMLMMKEPLPLLNKHPELQDMDPNLKKAMIVIKSLEADTQVKDIISLQPRLQTAVNLLWLVVQKKDSEKNGTGPAAISEFLRILYLYADKEVSFKDKIGNSIKATAPAAVESLLSAA